MVTTVRLSFAAVETVAESSGRSGQRTGRGAGRFGAFILCAWLLRSRAGYYWQAIRENEEAAQALGINTFRWKIFAVALSSAMTAVSGVFFAFSNFVMAALGRIPAAEGMRAMQEINVTVINPLFMGALFGTALLSVITGVVAVVAFEVRT